MSVKVEVFTPLLLSPRARENVCKQKPLFRQHNGVLNEFDNKGSCAQATTIRGNLLLEFLFPLDEFSTNIRIIWFKICLKYVKFINYQTIIVN